MEGTRCGRGAAALIVVTELGYVRGDTQSYVPPVCCHMSLLPCPLPWQQHYSTHRGGLWWPTNLVTKQTACRRAKGGRLVLPSSLTATVRKENEEFWELWCKSSFMSVRISFLVWLTLEFKEVQNLPEPFCQVSNEDSPPCGLPEFSFTEGSLPQTSREMHLCMSKLFQ